MKSEEKSEFYTPKGYRAIDHILVTESMEDYMECMYRITSIQGGYARIRDVASMLNVHPSSASKMVNKLESMDLVQYSRYGIIQLTPAGEEMGAYLVLRHKTIDAFLRLINGTDNEMRQTEQIEHFLNKKTVENLEKVTAYLMSEKWRDV